MPRDVTAYRRRLARRAGENRRAFNGKYKEEIKGLLGLSRKQVGRITPDETDLEIYDQLITVVKEASAANIKQAELKKQISDLGSIAVKIAKRVPQLRSLFA